MDVLSLIISLVSGIIGGNVAGAASKDSGLGGVGNTIVGLIGGGAGSWALQALDLFGKVSAAAGSTAATTAAHTASSGIDLTSLLQDIGGGGVGGAILVFIVNLIKNSMNKA